MATILTPNNLGKTLETSSEQNKFNVKLDQASLTIQQDGSIEIAPSVLQDIATALANSSAAQAQSDWAENSSSDPAYILNKPTALSDFANDMGIEPGAQVNVKPDWNALSNSAAEILNKPTKLSDFSVDLNLDAFGEGVTNKPFTQAMRTKLAQIESGAQRNVQSDWDQADSNEWDYIKNKPTDFKLTLTDATASSSALPAAGTPTFITALLQSIRNRLKSLGTAATGTLTTSSTDTTANRVLKVGDGGWLGVALNPSDAASGLRRLCAIGYTNNNGQTLGPTPLPPWSTYISLVRNTADDGHGVVFGISSGASGMAEGAWYALRPTSSAPTPTISWFFTTKNIKRTLGSDDDFPISQKAASENLVQWYGAKTKSNLPAAGSTPVGAQAFCLDGLKLGESSPGTGTPVWNDGTVWRVFYDIQDEVQV